MSCVCKKHYVFAAWILISIVLLPVDVNNLQTIRIGFHFQKKKLQTFVDCDFMLLTGFIFQLYFQNDNCTYLSFCDYYYIKIKKKIVEASRII